MEYVMDTILKFYGASLVCVILIIGMMSAYANTGRWDVAPPAANAGTNSAGVQMALNPQPLPPRKMPRWRQH
jgi:hypothetical protein